MVVLKQENKHPEKIMSNSLDRRAFISTGSSPVTGYIRDHGAIH